jgi:hypothetical protein
VELDFIFQATAQLAFTQLIFFYVYVGLVVLLSWCTVRVSDYRHGKLCEETFPLEMRVKHQVKKVGQLHFGIVVENIALFEDNQSNLAASEVCMKCCY